MRSERSCAGGPDKHRHSHGHVAPKVTMQEYKLTAAGRAQRYRRKKAGKEVKPSLRSQHAARLRAIAEQANVSVRTVRRYLRQKQLEEAGITGISLRLVKRIELFLLAGFMAGLMS